MGYDETCYSCRVTAQGEAAPLWQRIYIGRGWRVAHSYNSVLPGWLVLVTERHITSLDELSEDEAATLGELIRTLSSALKQVVGAAKCYVVFFAEQAEHTHAHIHIVPRAPDLPADRRGTNVFAYLKQPLEQWVSEEQRNEISAALRSFL